MKKKIVSLILLFALSACMNVGLALGIDYGTAIIDGRNADRVHLRERSAEGSSSLGLYFTGTEVRCESDPKAEWVKVTVGSQIGYMKSEFLYRGSKPGSIRPKQPAAAVKNIKAGSWVNLRSEPSLRGAAAGKLYYGDSVTVLGETASNWYYVKAGDLYGYVMSDYLSASGGSSADAPKDPFGKAVVDGRSADRVHLRERSSEGSNSLGLYFTGTEVMLKSDPNKEWVSVTIGSQSGYMKSEYLYRGTNPGSIHSKQPAASVKNVKAGSWVNLRSVPSLSGAVAGKLYNGDAVTVLGETAGNWCYVKTGSLLGYVMTDYLSIGGSVSPGEPSSKGYTMLLYTDVPNNNSSVKIQYPKFTGAGFDALNALIYSKVKGFVPSGNTGLTIDYQAAVTLKNSKIVSIVFWGSSYISGGAHPFTDLIALNVDLSSMREITFADLYDTDNGFEDVFFEKAFFPTNPVTSYKASSFSEMLKLQEPENQSVSPFGTPDNVSCFLKPDGIVLSMSAVHATGSDHFEAQLKYSDIQQFYRLGQKYWEN
jgi:uncharacterized protein YgiM (DUF1202 family)